MLAELRFYSGSVSPLHDLRKANYGGPSPCCDWCRQVLGNEMPGEACSGDSGKNYLLLKDTWPFSAYWIFPCGQGMLGTMGKHLAISRGVNPKTTPQRKQNRKWEEPASSIRLLSHQIDPEISFDIR